MVSATNVSLSCISRVFVERDGSPDLLQTNPPYSDDTMSVLNFKGVNVSSGLDVSDFNAVDFAKFEDIGKKY